MKTYKTYKNSLNTVFGLPPVNYKNRLHPPFEGTSFHIFEGSAKLYTQ